MSGAKGKKNWEQLQQESDGSEGVQVGHHVTTQSDVKDDDCAPGSDKAEEGWQGRGGGEERAGSQ